MRAVEAEFVLGERREHGGQLGDVQSRAARRSHEQIAAVSTIVASRCSMPGHTDVTFEQRVADSRNGVEELADRCPSSWNSRRRSIYACM